MSPSGSSKSILIVATTDSGGAGTAIHRLYSSLSFLGYNVKFLVQEKSGMDENIIQLENKRFHFEFIKKKWLKFVKNKWPYYNTNTNFYFFNKFEREHDNEIKKIKFDKYFKPDIIIGSWISGFANF